MLWWPIKHQVPDPSQLVPLIEMEPLADEQDVFLTFEERETRAGDVLVRGVLGEDGEGEAGLVAEVSVYADEVERGGDEDDGVGALDGGFEDGGESLGGEIVEPLFGFVLGAVAVEVHEVLRE